MTSQLKKTVWLKHTWINGKGGMNEAKINSKDETQLLVKSATRKNGHRFTTLSKENFLKLIERDYNFQEILQPDRPCKVFFDIEFDEKKGTYPGAPLEEITQFITSIFPDPDLQVSGSMTQTKNSYHIALNNYIFRDVNDLYKFKPFAQNYQEVYGFDPEVYSSHRCMKCVNQSKDDGRVQNVIQGYSNDWSKHLITAFIPDNAKIAIQYHDFNQYATSKVVKDTTNKTVKTRIDWNDIKPVDDVFINKQLAVSLRLKDIYDLENENEFKTILNIIPNPPYSHRDHHNHNTVWNIMRWACHHGISIIDFIAWAKQRDGEDVEPYYQQWENIKKSSYNPVRTTTIKILLSKYYPEITKKKNMLKFINLQQVQADTYINKQWLSVNDLHSSRKYVCLRIGMGGNKTGAIIDYLSNTNKSWVWITPRITLGKNTMGRMESAHITPEFYKKFNAKQLDKLRASKKLIIQLQSLWKVGANSYDIVIIDEIESVLQAWLATNTHGKDNAKIRENWESFKHILQTTGKVFFLDAFLSNTSLRLIEDIEKNNQTQREKIGALDNYVEREEREYKPYTVIARSPDVVVPTRVVRCLPGYSELVHKLVSSLREGKKVYCFYPYGASGTNEYPKMEDFANQIISHSGLNDDDVLTYWKNTDDKLIENLHRVNEEWSPKRLIIANSKITVGVNFDVVSSMFDDIFLFYIKWMNPRDIAQASCRARHITGHIYTAKMPIKGGYSGTALRPCICEDPVYNSLYKNLLVEEEAKNWETYMWFMREAGYTIEGYEYSEVFNDDIHDADISFKYDDIAEVCDDIDELMSKEITNTATTDDKIRLEKYYFQMLFNKDTPKEILSSVWESNTYPIFRAIKEVRQDRDHPINKIMRENNLTSYILPAHTINQFHLSKELRNELEEKYTLRSYFKDSHTGTLIHRVWENHFKMSLFEKEQERQGKTRGLRQWVMSDKFVNIIEIADKYL